MITEESRTTMCPQGLPSCKNIYACDQKGRCVSGSRAGNCMSADIFRLKKEMLRVECDFQTWHTHLRGCGVGIQEGLLFLLHFNSKNTG